ncbi:hypothetical protein [Sutcliffiella halmapala]|uniref:hypothetical protein n=1 Tax=Sutcliffiella halmapala TaxID=79882 RepID=UPI0009954E6F|nr:hypothetical protein [Sutcliffiella halmapala]
MKNWATKVDDVSNAGFFSDNNMIEMEIGDMALKLNKYNIKALHEYDETPTPSILTEVEQLILAPFYVYNSYNFVYKVNNLNDYEVDKINQIAKHFNKVQGIYFEDNMNQIQLMEAKSMSLTLFNDYIEGGRVNPYVKAFYLSPSHEVNISGSVFDIMKSGCIRVFYKFNKEFVTPINSEDIVKIEHLIEFFNINNPSSYVTTPNKLVFNESLLNNFGLRLLSTIYKTTFCCIDSKSNVILYLGGTNK